MPRVSGSATGETARLGRLNYLDASLQSSLYRNGKVLLRRDADGSDSDMRGVVFDERQITVLNARLPEACLSEARPPAKKDGQSGPARCSLEANGFELLPRPLERPDLDFFDHREVVQDYYRECAQIVSQTTGAASVVAFDHNVRSAAGKQRHRRIRGGQQVQGPASIAHGDYTLRSAPERLQQLARPPGGNDTLRSVLGQGQAPVEPAMARRAIAPGGRFAIINVWRNIDAEPVATHPLALCDAQSVRPEDLVVFEIHYQDRVGENYFSKYAPRHRWYAYPAMTRDEALLIKQWDSAGPLARSAGRRADSDDARTPCTFSFHTAYQEPSTRPDAPERWSIEVRCVALYA